ncbi:MAG: hypothetical protein H5U38_11735 [Calditrichaeota bacterium]|nr:hypothetical protein [Calditrichota bacterium]
MSLWLVGQVLPLTYAVSLLRGLWMGEPGVKYLNGEGIIAFILLLAVVILAKAFCQE